MASRLPITGMAHAQPSSDLTQQNALIAHHMVYHLLKEQGIRLNGYASGNGHSTHTRSILARDKGFRDAISALESSCADMRHKYGQTIIELVSTLDISDSYVYSSFVDSCNKLMDDDIRWGRIAVLFFFSGVFSERLYREGHSSKIESLVGWLTTFINDNLSHWILEHGGWAGIEGAVNVEGSKTQNKSKGSSGWLTLAAVGVGAAIVGVLTIR